MKMTISTARVSGIPQNCRYPGKCVIDNAQAFVRFVAGWDHVCGRFTGNYRKLANFEYADCVVMDCDNDDSENPEDWIYPEAFAEMAEGVSCVIVTSRNHMKAKGNKAAKPRFHVYFPIEPTESATECAALKRAIYARWPIFDRNALDAARFIFSSPAEEVIWQEGTVTIDRLLAGEDAAA